MTKRAPNPEQTAESDLPPNRIERGTVTELEIAHRAYQIYRNRGGQDGSAVDDWLEAERELNQRSSIPFGFPPPEDALKRTG